GVLLDLRALWLERVALREARVKRDVCGRRPQRQVSLVVLRRPVLAGRRRPEADVFGRNGGRLRVRAGSWLRAPNRKTKRHVRARRPRGAPIARQEGIDRKSTRLNSSHGSISYAVFCLKKKKRKKTLTKEERTKLKKNAAAIIHEK